MGRGTDSSKFDRSETETVDFQFLGKRSFDLKVSDESISFDGLSNERVVRVPTKN